MTKVVGIEPLTAEAFAPFGIVFSPPPTPGRTGGLVEFQNFRPAARPRLTMTCMAPIALPHAIGKLEKHPHSNQVFMPLDLKRFLVIAVPSRADGSPDLSGVRAFVGEGPQCFSYAADVWHAGFEVFDAEGRYAVLISRDGGPEDTLFFDLPQKLRIEGAL